MVSFNIRDRETLPVCGRVRGSGPGTGAARWWQAATRDRSSRSVWACCNRVSRTNSGAMHRRIGAPGRIRTCGPSAPEATAVSRKLRQLNDLQVLPHGAATRDNPVEAGAAGRHFGVTQDFRGRPIALRGGRRFELSEDRLTGSLIGPVPWPGGRCGQSHSPGPSVLQLANTDGAHSILGSARPSRGH